MIAMMIASVILGTFLLAQVADQPQGASKNHQSEEKRAPTAEDILRALRQRSSVNEVIPPSSIRGQGSPSKGRHWSALFPEGSTWIDRTGHLERDGDWWRFVDATEDAASVRVLPNSNFEVMVRTVRSAGELTTFKMSGEFTVFQDSPYLLVRSSVRLMPSSPSLPEVKRAPADASAAKVLERMQDFQPAEAAMIAERDEAPSETASHVQYSKNTLLEGTPVIQRVGRLTRQEGWWVMRSDSQSTDSPDTPLRMLPNQALDVMVRETEAGGQETFVVSGEVMLYFGENYLLARVATRHFDLGNLRK